MIISAPKWRLLILFVISFTAAWIVYAPLLKIAIKKNIVDNPDARKLQKTPVPVLGGLVVFFGIAVGLMFFKTMFYQNALLPVLAAMTIMLYTGTIDDIQGLTPSRRLLIEIGVGLLMVYGSKSCIFNFQELWGVGKMHLGWAIPLTLFTIVGIINAINMIDGIDGLLSGFGIMICGFFGLACFLAHDYSNAALSAVTIGALVPFFIHNVFGKKTKMFLGDGGSMLLGIIISWMVITILGGHFHLIEYQPFDFNLIAFCLAVLAIPIADTLRVMFSRLFKGQSPFTPDRNHFHHLFLNHGLSHLQTAITMIVLALTVISVFFASWILGASDTWQLYIVILTTAAIDGGGAWLLRRSGAKVSPSNHGKHIRRKIQTMLDSGFDEK